MQSFELPGYSYKVSLFHTLQTMTMTGVCSEQSEQNQLNNRHYLTALNPPPSPHILGSVKSLMWGKFIWDQSHWRDSGAGDSFEMMIANANSNGDLEAGIFAHTLLPSLHH